MGDAMKILQNSDGRQTTLIFSGALDLPNACKAHQALSEAIRNYTHVVVYIKQAEGIDLSFLQLICSAHRTATSQKKHFSLALEGNDSLKEVLILIGFDRHCGCGSDETEPCIWQTAASRGNKDAEDDLPAGSVWKTPMSNSNC